MSKKKRNHITAIASVNKERNMVALNPLLRKSAVHEKSTKARRQSDKVKLKKTWFERVAA